MHTNILKVSTSKRDIFFDISRSVSYIIAGRHSPDCIKVIYGYKSVSVETILYRLKFVFCTFQLLALPHNEIMHYPMTAIIQYHSCILFIK